MPCASVCPVAREGFRSHGWGRGTGYCCSLRALESWSRGAGVEALPAHSITASQRREVPTRTPFVVLTGRTRSRQTLSGAFRGVPRAGDERCFPYDVRGHAVFESSQGLVEGRGMFGTSEPGIR